MRTLLMALPVLLLVCLTGPAYADDLQPSEMIAGKMAFKLTRGVTNVATSFVELPKQIILTLRDDGPIGFVTGPLKGIGMTGYRAFIGAIETTLFMVPQPGYYHPMINPEFVWEGWEGEPERGTIASAAPDGKKGE